MNLGKAIKELRKKRELSQKELSVACGITQTALSQIEVGIVNPSSSTIKKLCKRLKISEPLLYVLANEINDVPKERQANYDILYPSIKSLIFQLVGEDK
jgi:transcriptional regulator with XRE-family HTH domain